MSSSDWTVEPINQFELLDLPSAAQSTTISQRAQAAQLSIDECDPFSDDSWLSNSRQCTSSPPQLQRVLNIPDAEPSAKRRRLIAADEVQSDPVPQTLAQPSWSNIVSDSLTSIDLTDATEVPQELKERRTDRRVKIAAFQCVICMDNVTALTVTHCGHLYCQQCLHSSLHVGATRGKCPMCRAKVDIKARLSYNSKTKGFWALELKLMTMAKKGKRKADEMP